jgi:hypothetical protein
VCLFRQNVSNCIIPTSATTINPSRNYRLQCKRTTFVHLSRCVSSSHCYSDCIDPRIYVIQFLDGGCSGCIAPTRPPQDPIVELVVDYTHPAHSSICATASRGHQAYARHPQRLCRCMLLHACRCTLSCCVELLTCTGIDRTIDLYSWTQRCSWFWM